MAFGFGSGDGDLLQGIGFVSWLRVTSLWRFREGCGLVLQSRVIDEIRDIGRFTGGGGCDASDFTAMPLITRNGLEEDI